MQTMVLTMQEKLIIASSEEGFRLSAQIPHWEGTENAKVHFVRQHFRAKRVNATEFNVESLRHP